MLVLFESSFCFHECSNCNIDISSCGHVLLGISQGYTQHIIVWEYEICHLSNRICEKLVKLFSEVTNDVTVFFLVLSPCTPHTILFHLSQSSLPCIF
jgi:hypothetical protein